jgi:hypothetical protein
MSGASPPLPSGMGGHPTVVHGTVARRGATAAANRGGGTSGGGLGWHGRIPKKDELGCQGELG